MQSLATVYETVKICLKRSNKKVLKKIQVKAFGDIKCVRLMGIINHRKISSIKFPLGQLHPGVFALGKLPLYNTSPYWITISRAISSHEIPSRTIAPHTVACSKPSLELWLFSKCCHRYCVTESRN